MTARAVTPAQAGVQPPAKTFALLDTHAAGS
jgi:hypothetical protein